MKNKQGQWQISPHTNIEACEIIDFLINDLRIQQQISIFSREIRPKIEILDCLKAILCEAAQRGERAEESLDIDSYVDSASLKEAFPCEGNPINPREMRLVDSGGGNLSPRRVRIDGE